MASAADVIAALDKFELDLIEKNWSDEIWTSEFTSCPEDISEEFSDRFSPLSYCDIAQVIEQSDKVVNMWLNSCVDSYAASDAESSNSSSVTGPSWTQLQEVDYRKLLSLLYYYICKGHWNNQDITSVHVCVKATNFYLTLLIIPGSGIYKIFQMALFEKCLETFSLHRYLEIATGRKIKKKSPRKNDEFSSDDEFLEMDETLTLTQQQNVVQLLNYLLSTFQTFINKFSFKKYPEALTMSLSVLADLTRLEKNSSLNEFSTNNVSTTLAPLSRNAFLTMKDFCSTLHGRVSEIIRLLLFHLMPNLTSIGGLANPEINKLNQKELNNMRQIAVSFIIDNIIPIGADAHLGLKILIQQLCFNMVDRADYRSKATDMVIAILCKLPLNLYFVLLKWIFRLSMMEGAHHRVISLELLSKLIFMKPGSEDLSKLTESQYQHLDSQIQNSQNLTVSRAELNQKSDSTSNLSQEQIVSFSQPVNYVPLEYRRAMFAIVVDRIRDESSIVRTRALTILSEIIANKSSQALQVILRDTFLHPYAESTSISLQPTVEENDFLKWKTFVTLLDKVQETGISKSLIPGARFIVNKVFEKCLDEKVNVRKSALQVISTLFRFSSKWMSTDSLRLYGKHCRDPALSIRKDMLNSITELMLFFPDHELLMELWVEEVVPLIMDREFRVQEQALQIYSSTILQKIVHFNKLKGAADELPWKLLDKIAKRNKRCFLLTATALWAESGTFTQSLISNLKSHVRTVNDGPAWVFLSAISEYFDIEKPDFTVTYYVDVIAKNEGDKNHLYFAMLTLSKSWQNLSREKMEILHVEMVNQLKSFSVSPTLVGLTVEIATGIAVLTAEDELTGKKEVAKWGIELIQVCEKHLENCMKGPKPQNSETECKDCINILALLGALIGICPGKIKHPTFLLLFNFLMNSKNGGSEFDRKIKAITVITLSKMALQSDHFARNLVPGLAQLLDRSSDPIVLNNVIVAIADIGECYANLIEPLIPFICVCMKSRFESLKEITLILLVELLQEDYLKARGALVFHLLTMINDSNSWLVNIVKYYFTTSLLARSPYKMYQLLLPAIFHFNNYTNHPDYPKLEMADAEAKAFDFSGPENHSKRMSIYQFMLSNVPDMVKMKCLHFICTVILNGAADNIITIRSRNGEQLLFDALCVLLTPEIKIEYNDLVNKKNEDGEEDDDQKQNPLYKLGKQMFTAAQKKEIIETIIPICCKLKKKLLVENKKFLPYLHKFVRELVKDYKSEITEIFKDDKQFGIEILHELEKMSNTEDEEEEEDEEELVRIMALENHSTRENEPFATENQPMPSEHPPTPSENPSTPTVYPRSSSENLSSPSENPSTPSEHEFPLSGNSRSDELTHLAPAEKDGETGTSGEQLASIPEQCPGENERPCSPSAEPSAENEPVNEAQTEKCSAENDNLGVCQESPQKKNASATSANTNTPLRESVIVFHKSTSRSMSGEAQENVAEGVTPQGNAPQGNAPRGNAPPGSSPHCSAFTANSSVVKHTRVISTNGKQQTPRPCQMRSVIVSLKRLSTECIAAAGKRQERNSESAPSANSKTENLRNLRESRNSQDQERKMEEAVHGIIMPPPSGAYPRFKKHSLIRSFCNVTPTTPVPGGRKELLTSTPLVRVDNSDFNMDISAVVEEPEEH